MIALTKKTALSFIVIVMVSCNGSDYQQAKEQPKDTGEKLIKVNKKLVRSEAEQIDDFLARYQWKVQQTGNGLRYMIYKHGQGAKASDGKLAKISYTMSLLTGEVVHPGDDKSFKWFTIGKGEIERGLDEGILFLRTGDRAKFILPSHLAYGLTGDGDKIPAKAVLVYDVELLELK
jgi:FKBP-type peptidyl-prolyl cis-trans isomerase